MRNFRCPHYDQCLIKAAKSNWPALPCRGCQFEHDRSGRFDLGDLPGCLALMAVVLCPELPPGLVVELVRDDTLRIAELVAGEGNRH